MAKKLYVDEAIRWANLEGLDVKIKYDSESEGSSLDIINVDGEPVGPSFAITKGAIDANGYPEDAEAHFGAVMEQYGRPPTSPPQLTLVK